MVNQRWVDLLLAHQKIGDPVADDVVEFVYHEGDLESINNLFKSLVRNEEVIREELPIAVCEYMDASNDLPPWADRKLLEKGSNVFGLNAPQIVLMLHLASLPTLYAADKGAQLLYLTQRMTSHIERRICETAQFVLDVTQDGAFEPDQRGIVASQKVRLMHAAIRHFVAHDPRWHKKWRKKWGTPISQSALVITMLSFSTVVIQCLEKSNILVTDEEKEAYLHLWKVVGHLLGIHNDLMPKDYDDSIEMLEAFKHVAYGATTEGRALTKVLLNFVQERVHVLPELISDWMRFWVGDETADLLEVPARSWATPILDVIQFAWGLESRIEHAIPLDERITDFMSRQLLEGLLTIERGGNRPHFRLPTDLRDRLSIGT